LKELSLINDLTPENHDDMVVSFITTPEVHKSGKLEFRINSHVRNSKYLNVYVWKWLRINMMYTDSL